MHNLMIDIKTLSKREDAAILSISAVFFDIESSELGESYYTNIATSTDENYGHIDASTVKWWMGQPDKARAALFDDDKAPALPVALGWFYQFIEHNCAVNDVNVWEINPSHDLSILKNASRRNSMRYPWRNHNERDVRTCVEMGKQLVGFDEKSEQQLDATHDIYYQACLVIEVFEQINARLIDPADLSAQRDGYGKLPITPQPQ